MKKFNAEITRKNILMLIRYSGITLEEFGNIIGVSKRWMQYLKKGRYDFDISAIEKASIFFNVSFGRLTTTLIAPPDDYRRTLQLHHKNNTEYSKILSENPSIPYTIEFILMKDSEFTTNPNMEIKDVRRILKNYNLVYKGSSLSTELQKSEFVECWPHSTKKNTNIYRKR
ncbi:helix-turn-helix transcriptional regulator [Sphingobacterium sp. DN00404]|uniref:Helix-turn-helix transcriptional regulator n=1 Tax=Sphingobacterium micropteri TaxID=2763501 RepID=A0ABR7YQF9_9SPHI|nr:helix-turn-helix transcriptional regulator [Sphingobacterium micropteri]MBD1433527.1 helix-turn-helix transcriptional regulator [Sphingobacterium micropteri]